MVAGEELGALASMRMGLELRGGRWISGGMVARKNKVCRVKGRSLQIFDVRNETHVEHAVGLVDHPR